MKKRRFSSLIGGVLAVALVIALFTVPFGGATASKAAYTALNPYGRIDAPNNEPLAPRLSTLAGKTIALVNWEGLSGGAVFMDNIKTLLGAGITFEERTIKLHFEQAQAWYDSLAAAADGVVFAVAEDNLTAYWGAVHLREMEKRGIPCTIVVNDRYEETLKVASEDHGITAIRYVTLAADAYAMAYSGLAARMPAIATGAAPEIVDNLTDALSAAEEAPPKIVPKDAQDSFIIMAEDYYEATALFNEMANDQGFGDGLPMTLPTREAVDAMLAGIDRGADEVLGRIRMRNGVATIEKVAINAVMAGAKPEFFPVIVAAVEVLAQGAEDYSYYYHALTTGEDYSLLLLLSGPLAPEIGVLGNTGSIGGDREANNTIGRAVKMALRNIGHNTTPYVDTASAGRINDHASIVITEQDRRVREYGYDPYHVTLGFTTNQSTVTVMAVGPWGANDMSDAFEATAKVAMPTGGNSLTRTTSSNVITSIGHFMMKPSYTGLNGTTAATNNQSWGNAQLGTPIQSGKDTTLIMFTPATASILKMPSTSIYGGVGGMGETGDRETIKNWYTVNGQGGQAYAAHKAVVQPIITGGDPGYTRVFKSTGYGMGAYRTQLITGATLTDNGKDDPAPSEPKNLTAIRGSGKVTLSWTAPDRLQGFVRYEASADGGVNWVDVGTSTNYTFTGLTDGLNYNFAVRAVSDLINAVTFDDSGNKLTSSSGRGAQALVSVGPTTVYISGPAAVTYLPGETATYTVSIANAPEITAIQLTLRVDGSYFDTKSASGLNGFAAVGDIAWKDIGGDMYEGTIVLAGTGAGNIDVFQVEFNLKGLLGVTDVELVDFEIAFEGGWVDFEYGNTIVTTSIDEWFSPYDLNHDGVVDLRDISIAMMYFMAEKGDSNWAQAVIADVNGDDIVDIDDLILIRANFT